MATSLNTSGQNLGGTTPPARFVPEDQEARDLIADDLEHTFFVEASAGTGKTTSLVQRMINLVQSGRTTMDRVAAITFTEAAAAELQERVRQGLERAADNGALFKEEQERCRQGIQDLDQSNVRTLHSFAQQLLQERPLEADLPPGFEVSDAMVAGIKFEEAWNQWLDVHLEADSPIAEELSLLISLGLTVSNLRRVARGFHDNYVDLQVGSFAAPEPPQWTAGQTLADKWKEVERLLQFSKKGEGDGLFQHILQLGPAVRAATEQAPGTNQYFQALNGLLPLKTTKGAVKDWETDPLYAVNAGTYLKRNLLNELHEAVQNEVDLAKRHALAGTLNALRQFVLEYAKHRRSEGRAEFNDLLIWARDLVRDNLEVRDYFRHRFTHILVDESQDTDPIQAEIAMLLAEDTAEGVPECNRALAWDQVKPAPGKLFVVGDPKQSIYRFRRADVTQVYRLQERLHSAGGETLNLTQNFRSHLSEIEFVNHIFGQWMRRDHTNESDGSGRCNTQPDYHDMQARWSAITDSEVGPKVWALGNKEMDGNIGPVRDQEAREIGKLLRQIVDDGWLKLDKDATERAGEEVFVPVTFSDICILIPTRTSLPQLERGLENFDIPFRLEAASLVLNSQEVRDLLNCLRAIDNPADQVAVVAALRSPAFGCSDVNLLLHLESGGSFDYLGVDDAGGTQTNNPVPSSLAALHKYHQRRVWEHPAALIEDFVKGRMLLESAAGNPRMRGQWRRYRFMVERARQFADIEGYSLRAFINWIEIQIAEGERADEAPVPESDEEAVRVMTIHAAKGLEFPVVVLTGINSRSNTISPVVLFDRSSGAVEVGLGPRDSRIATPGYEDLLKADRARDQEEAVRKMYVATTRARDHLVLSLRRTDRDKNSPAKKFSEFMQGCSNLWSDVVLKEVEPPEAEPDEEDASRPVPPGLEHTPEARKAWEEERENLLQRLTRPAVVAATALNQPLSDDKPETEETEGREPWKRGRAGTSLGRAVHAVLQSIDLTDKDGVAQLAGLQATVEGIPNQQGNISNLVQVALESEAVKRAVSSQRLWREVPVAAPIGNGFIHGFIDLLFEESDGLVIVDYKTDYITADDLSAKAEQYLLQGEAYAYAMQKATGKKVKDVIFLYLHRNQEYYLPNLSRGIEEVEEKALALLANPQQTT